LTCEKNSDSMDLNDNLQNRNKLCQQNFGILNASEKEEGLNSSWRGSRIFLILVIWIFHAQQSIQVRIIIKRLHFQDDPVYISGSRLSKDR